MPSSLRTLLALCVAAAALVVFGAVAASVQAPVDTDRGRDPTGPEADVQPDRPGAPGGERCLLCGADGAQGLAARLLPDLSGGAVAALAAAALAVLALVWWRAGAGDEPRAGDATVDGTTTRHATAPEGSGPAGATDPPPPNGVYRAWEAFVDRLDPPRGDATTPSEYAAAARRRGFDDGAVSRLTTLFRRVRYGPAEPSEADERRARGALERIEADDPPGDDGAGADAGRRA